jgi:hypothetical protein
MKKSPRVQRGQGADRQKYQGVDKPTAPPASTFLKIELAITFDGMDGQPWPPCLMDGWQLIRTVAGRSTWRRISLNRNTETKDANHQT